MAAICVYIAILIIYVFLFFYTRKFETEEWMGKDKLLHPFYKAAQLVAKYVKLFSHDSHGMKQRTTVSDDLKILYPDTARKQESCYLFKKLAYMMLIIFAGTVIALCMCINNRIQAGNNTLTYLTRGDYGTGSREISIFAETETGTFEEPVTVTVGEREYTKQEAYAWIDLAIEALPTLILSENSGFDCITENLDLLTEVDDIPVRIEWSSDHYEWMDARGNITATEIPDEGVICTLTAKVSCQNYFKESVLFARICPPRLSYEEQLREDIKEAVRMTEADDRTSTEIMLPAEVSGNSIIWSNRRKDNSVTFFVMAMLFAVSVYPAMDRDLHKKVTQRKQNMAREYPEFISKLVLFMGAGMTIRGAFHRIAQDYTKRSDRSGDKEKKTVPGSIYEEVVRVCHEIDSGISEGQAYLNLGKRCDDPHYVRLSMLLSQNLRKGNAGLTALLESEAAQAFDERKRNARKYGEEAGTKLLGPMMLMLLIVMILIMVPAFTSFGG